MATSISMSVKPPSSERVRVRLITARCRPADGAITRNEALVAERSIHAI
jgi:hypothetical protein